MEKIEIFLSDFNGLKTEACLWVKDGEIELVIQQQNPDRPGDGLDMVALDLGQIKSLASDVLSSMTARINPQQQESDDVLNY